jgi:pSer/pThr/pTyr-binding forkhead associated (FHA) protein
MPRFALRYIGHRPGAALAYFTGASVDLVPGAHHEISAQGLLIGRRADVDLRVASAHVAPKHARVRAVADGFTVEDLGSTNGTTLNGAPLHAPTRLALGDRLLVAAGFEFEVIALSDDEASSKRSGELVRHA